jgi:sulfite reductase alpha subunit-like flavoprotein
VVLVLTLVSAQYELSPGEVLGDPAQVQLTKDIIALGWQPPTPKTRWDILPLVVMAEGDEPEFATLPPELTQLVSIAHPQYPKIADLDLRWGKFPALSRLGFDIGGVQYTASPFIGWFMDAEIAVRNLADTFRYNVLPEVAKAIGWSSPSHTFGELPDHERLLWLSRAQAELNYAVYCSFQKAGVTCTSSLTASHSWTTFDDQHLREKGYRLNADPYWISPPQGSVVPLWHRGGAPNYQPKPLIARHRCDPVRVWNRRYNALNRVEGQLDNADYDEDRPTGPRSEVHIFYCGTNGTAAKLAERLRIFMAKKSSKIVGEFGTLNSFDPCKIYPGGTALFIVSTTGTGEIPSNGQQFIKKMNAELAFPLLKFSILGIGDSGYHGTFNWACKSVQRILKEKQLKPLMLDCVTESDVSVENPPWTDFRMWCSRIERALDGKTEEGNLEPGKTDHIDNLYEKQYNILKAYKKATMRFDPFIHRPGEILKLSLEIPESDYEPMGHIRLLPRNSEVAAQRVMTLLEINDNQTIGTAAKENPVYPSQIQDQRQVQLLAVPIRQFLKDFVDLRSPFISMDWAQNLSNVKNGPALQVLEHLSLSLQHISPSISPMEILLSLTPLRPRSYSIASSSEQTVDPDTSAIGTTLDVFVRIVPNGRFSHHCLSEVGNGGKILYKLTPNNICLPLLKLNGKPLVAVACGTGIAPVRSLLQYLIRTNNTGSKISVFIGFRPDDSSTELFIEIAEQALEKGILDILDVVPSNKEKVRVQDHFGDCKEALRRKLGEEAGYFYVCGNAVVVREVKDRLKGVLGLEIWTRVQERILEETF